MIGQGLWSGASLLILQRAVHLHWSSHLTGTLAKSPSLSPPAGTWSGNADHGELHPLVCRQGSFCRKSDDMLRHGVPRGAILATSRSLGRGSYASIPPSHPPPPVRPGGLLLCGGSRPVRTVWKNLGVGTPRTHSLGMRTPALVSLWLPPLVAWQVNFALWQSSSSSSGSMAQHL